MRAQLSDPDLDRVIDALEPINANSPDARTRAGQIGRLLLALDIVATAARDLPGRDEPERAVPPAVAAALALIERTSPTPGR